MSAAPKLEDHHEEHHEKHDVHDDHGKADHGHDAHGGHDSHGGDHGHGGHGANDHHEGDHDAHGDDHGHGGHDAHGHHGEKWPGMFESLRNAVLYALNTPAELMIATRQLIAKVMSPTKKITPGPIDKIGDAAESAFKSVASVAQAAFAPVVGILEWTKGKLSKLFGEDDHGGHGAHH